MKTLFKTLAVGTFAFAFITTGSAQTIIRITGAQAFGDATHRAIAHLLGAPGAKPYTLSAGNSYAYTGTDIDKAQQSIWTGTIGGNPVIIKTSFNGSTAGIRITTKGTLISWLANTTTQTAAGTALGSTTPTLENSASDAAVADTFQSSTSWTSPTLVDRQVGAGAYVFVASKQAPARLTNVTSIQARALYKTGYLPLAVFTGLSSDRTTLFQSTFGDSEFGGPAPLQVYATGRDPESGARLVTFIETGIGASAAVLQYQPTISSGSVTNQILYPATTLNGQPLAEGNNGNSSNGNLATTVLPANTVAGLGGYYVSYLPSLDAANAVTAGAHALQYNGVDYTATNVAEGTYSLWAYEHLFYKNGLTTPQVDTLEALATRLKNFDATLLIGNLQVKRTVDGGVITTKY